MEFLWEWPNPAGCRDTHLDFRFRSYYLHVMTDWGEGTWHRPPPSTPGKGVKVSFEPLWKKSALPENYWIVRHPWVSWWAFCPYHREQTHQRNLSRQFLKNQKPHIAPCVLQGGAHACMCLCVGTGGNPQLFLRCWHPVVWYRISLWDLELSSYTVRWSLRDPSVSAPRALRLQTWRVSLH